MKSAIMRFIAEENGGSAIEYCLLASLIAVGIVAALGEVATALNNTFTTIKNALSS
ncbi:MAG: Flp family type IVb pilin [Alphaproteobacteria bacterium]|nr:Flp family type IVb pilin [Alphaproteobacteria bacterium]